MGLNEIQINELTFEDVSISDVINKVALQICDQQAEISFKAGIKEVLNIIKKDTYFCDDVMDGDTLPNEPDRYLVQFSKDTWLKLKEIR